MSETILERMAPYLRLTPRMEPEPSKESAMKNAIEAKRQAELTATLREMVGAFTERDFQGMKEANKKVEVYWPEPPAHTPVALLDAPKPEPLVAHGPDPELEAHAALAKKLGVAVYPKLGALKLRNILAEEGLTCYDKKAVRAYMDSLAGQTPNTSWFWFHAIARQVLNDTISLGYYNRGNALDLEKIQGSIIGSVYRDAIPLPVLLTIDKLLTRLGDDVVPVIAATFELSKLRPAPADPFLAVLMREEDEMFIIERWDEPGFRGIKA